MDEKDVEDYLQDSAVVEVEDIQKNREEDKAHLERVMNLKKVPTDKKPIFDSLKRDMEYSEVQLIKATDKLKNFLTAYPELEFSLPILNSLVVLRAYAELERKIRIMLEFYIGLVKEDSFAKIVSSKLEGMKMIDDLYQKEGIDGLLDNKSIVRIAGILGKSVSTIENYRKDYSAKVGITLPPKTSRGRKQSPDILIKKGKKANETAYEDNPKK